MNKSGFTLLELTISTALIIVVFALGLIAVKSSSASVSLNRGKAQLQEEARRLMIVLGQELEQAVKPAPAGMSLPYGVKALTILNNGEGVRIQLPNNEAFTSFGTAIEYHFETEDSPVAGSNPPVGNAWLDPGEDANNDGILNRHIVRVQNGQSRILGAANSIAHANFELIDAGNVLRISLILTAPMGDTRSALVRHELQRDIYLMN